MNANKVFFLDIKICSYLNFYILALCLVFVFLPVSCVYGITVSQGTSVRTELKNKRNLNRSCTGNHSCKKVSTKNRQIQKSFSSNKSSHYALERNSKHSNLPSIRNPVKRKVVVHEVKRGRIPIRYVSRNKKKASSRRRNVYLRSRALGNKKQPLLASRRPAFFSSFLSTANIPNSFTAQLNKKFYFERILLRSNFVYIVDQRSHDSLFDKNSHVIVPIASITKLMTAIVVLNSGLPLDEILTITAEDHDYEKWTSSRLRKGSKLTRADMLHIALMSSENRAASALSRYYPGGRSAFIMAMNKKAQELGMFHTFFKNATGLSRQNVSTARDLVRLVEAAYRYPLIRKYSTDSNYTVNTGMTTLQYGSTNSLVKNRHWDIGLQKTGFINEAGECLVMQAVISSRPVIMVFLDSNGKYSRIGDAETVRHWLLATR